MLEHFRRTGLASLPFCRPWVQHADFQRPPRLLLGGSTALAPLPHDGPYPTYAGDLSAISALHLPRWVEEYLYEPGRPIARDDGLDGQDRRHGRKGPAPPRHPRRRHPQLDPHPGRSRAHRDLHARDPQEIWPQLECVVHGGVPLAPFLDPLRARSAPRPSFTRSIRPPRASLPPRTEERKKACA